MNAIKQAFNLTAPYKFEWNDLRALAMLLNVILVMTIGFSASWFGLGIAAVGIVKDLTDKEKRINGLAMHLASVALNIYFLTLMYGGK